MLLAGVVEAMSALLVLLPWTSFSQSPGKQKSAADVPETDCCHHLYMDGPREKAERKRMADSGFTALYCMRHPDWLMQISVGKYTQSTNSKDEP